MHQQLPGERPAEGHPHRGRVRPVRILDSTGSGLMVRLRLSASRPLLALILRGGCLVASLAAAIRYPTLIVAAAAVWLWVLWPAYAVRRRTAPALAPAPAERSTAHALALWYSGGHPALPRPGRAWLRVWKEDGAAVLRVGRRSVAFPLHSVRAVSLVEGRMERRTGCRGALASLVGRVLARGAGRFCGLRRDGQEDFAVIDRSRVVCDLVRNGHSCRLMLTGRAGGGEQIYLEALVRLRSLESWRDAGASGGARGTAASPQNGD